MAMSNVSLDILKSYSTAINSSRHWAQALSLLKDLQDLRLADLIATSAAINSIGRRSAWRCATGLLPRSADVIAFNAALKALATRWRQAMQLLQDMAISSLQSDIISMNSMVNACAKASLWQWVTLQLQTTQDRVTYCCCISALEKDCEWQRAQQLFWELRHTFSCDLIAYNASMSSYEKAGNWDLSLLLFDDLKEHRLSPDVITFNAAISSQQAQWQFANHLLDSLRLQRAYPEVISYSAATHCCALASSWQHAVQTAAGRGADAVTGHDGRGRRGPVPCNAAINACEKVAKWPWALHSFAILPTRRWTPDEVTCGSVMSALVGWQQALAFLPEIQGLSQPGIIISNAAISACAKGGAWPKALELLEQRLQIGDANIVTFSAAISACEKGGVWQQAVQLLRAIPRYRLQATVISYNATISACEKGDAWQMACELLAETRNSSSQANLTTFNATLAAGEKANLWQRILHLLCSFPAMKLEEDAISLSSGISACEQGCLWQLAHHFWSRGWTDAATFGDVVSACEKEETPLVSRAGLTQ